MTISSLPVIPAQPNQAAYAVSELNLFGTMTRASFLAAFDVQAPPYDPAQPTRTWFDTSASPGPYQAVQVSGSSASIVSLAVPKNVSLPNLPGAYSYLAWANAETMPNGQPTPVNSTLICSLSDAEAVVASMPGSALSEDPEDQNVNWGPETRRMYLVTPPGGQAIFAAELRAQMTVQVKNSDGSVASGGVGAPGTWNFATPGAPVWVPTPDPGLTAGPEMPVPCRPLMPNEQFAPGPLGMGVEVIRTDMGPAAQASGGGGLTAAQAAAIAQIPGMATLLNTIAQRFGITP